MKNIILLSSCLLLSAFAARAGLITTAMTGGSTNAFTYVATASTNSPLAVLTTVQGQLISINCAFSCTASNGAAVTLRFDTSVDNANWVTNTLSWPITAAGTAALVSSTNLSIGATPFIRVRVVENPGPAGVTNLLVNAFTKNGL